MTDKYLQRLLGENEKIVHSSRQHWFLLLGSLLLEIFFIAVILAGVFLNYLFLPKFLLFGIVIGLVLFLIPFISMLKDILEWQNRQYIVTNRRVLQTTGVFNKSIIDSSLEKVNDVKMVQSFLGRIFDFGDIEILTASELGVNLFKRIHDPVLFKTSMMNAKEKLNDDGAPMHYSASIPVMIEEMDQLRRKGIITNEEFQEKKRELLSKL